MGTTLANPKFAFDEALWFGDGADEEAESRAAASLAAVGARIVGAKPFPIAARRLDELTRTTNTRIEQVVSVLESDPALSARLLRLVNSAGYGLKIRCTSVRHAAVLVGTRRLNQVATTAAILDLFDANNARAVELLEHAAVVGSLCRYLAVHVGLPHDELFTCGFLHDIGKLMLLDAERARYGEMLAEFGGAPDQLHVEERRAFGFDHAVLGAHVLAAWNIPDPVPKVIAWHHAPARALQDTVLSSMVQTLRLADLLAYVLALHDDKTGIEIVANSDAARYLDISDAQLAAMWEDLVALRDRSRARSQGEPELDAMVPKAEPSLRPRASRATVSPNSTYRAGRPLQEVPAHFPCGVCGKPSYGNVCPSCGGHVCPDHQGPGDEWCTTCRRDFVHFRKSDELPLAAKIGVGALVGGTLATGLVGAVNSPSEGIAGRVLPPLVVIALWAVVLPVAYKLWQKLRFLHTRRQIVPASGVAVARSSLSGLTEDPPALGDDSLIDLQEPPSGPELTIGPISTASLSLSAAPQPMGSRSVSPRSAGPRSVSPLSMAPASVPPSSHSRGSSGALPAASRSVTPVSPSWILSEAPSLSRVASAAEAPRTPTRTPDVSEAPAAGSMPAVAAAPRVLTPVPDSPPPVAIRTRPSFPDSLAAVFEYPARPSAPASALPNAPAPEPTPSESSLSSLAVPAAAPEPAAAPPEVPAGASEPRISAEEPSEKLPSESGSHVVWSRRPQANTALPAARAIRCSPVVLNSCSTSTGVFVESPRVDGDPRVALQ